MLLPRHLEIIYEINRRCSIRSGRASLEDEGRVQRVSLIEEGETKTRADGQPGDRRLAQHQRSGRNSHSQLLRKTTVKDLAEMFPERFSNKTNGVTPRRWLLLANPVLAGTITEAIGESWVTDLSQLSKLAPLAGDKGFRDRLPEGQAASQIPVCRLA
jgi:starch phosphorylase